LQCSGENIKDGVGHAVSGGIGGLIAGQHQKRVRANVDPFGKVYDTAGICQPERSNVVLDELLYSSMKARPAPADRT
jgi:hypothetical protein